MSKTTALCILAVFTLSAPSAHAQDLDGVPFVHGTDAEIDLFMGDWRESMPRKSHGSLVERDILTKGNSLAPTVKGAVLEKVNRFVYCELAAGHVTEPTTLENEQEIFYFLSGSGEISAGGVTEKLYPGIAVLMPAGLDFTMKNTGNEMLTAYLVVEPTPPGFTPRSDMLVRDENSVPVGTSNSHWVGIVKGLFGPAEGLATTQSILTCAFSPMTMFHPHSHVPGCEEVWIPVNADIYALLGKQLRLQHPGTAYMIPPDSKTPHANINVSDRMVKMFYFARYGDDYGK